MPPSMKYFSLIILAILSILRFQPTRAEGRQGIKAECPQDDVIVTPNPDETMATVNFNATCKNMSGVIRDATCSPISGDTSFEVGNTNVTCLCTEGDDRDECSFVVKVQDVTNPNATCPSDQPVNAQDELNTTAALVDFDVSCSDNFNDDIKPNCNSTANDTHFPIGETTVSCSCRDDAGNSDTCSFRIIVKGESPGIVWIVVLVVIILLVVLSVTGLIFYCSRG